MDLETLREQTCANLSFLYPQWRDGVARMVDECFESAHRAFKTEFMCSISPQAWARITLIYFKEFVEAGCDVSIGEIVAEVIRDSIHTSRMDMLTQSLGQKKLDQAQHHKKPSLTVVKDD